MTLIMTSIVVSGFHIQLQILRWLYLIELQEFLKSLELLNQ